MKALALGAVLALVWFLLGSPLVTITAVLPVLVEPVVLGFLLGLAARHLHVRLGHGGGRHE